MLVLLTGVPGCGKTSLARALVDQHPDVVDAVSFGRLVFDSVRRRTGFQCTYDEFRSTSATMVTAGDVAEATIRLIARVNETEAKKVVILDSHAVARERFGYRCTPDDPETLRRLGYACILHLYVPSRVIVDRVQAEPAGRLSRSTAEIDLHEQLQLAVSTYYAGVLGCPLLVLDGHDSPGEIAEVAWRLLSAPSVGGLSSESQ